MKGKKLICLCHYEPRGDKGLEGFIYNEEYQCQSCFTSNNVHYWKVWPSAFDKKYPDNFYHVCSSNTFLRFFNLKR